MRGGVSFGSAAVVSESWRAHRNFTAKTAKNAKIIAKDIALLTHRAIATKLGDAFVKEF